MLEIGKANEVKFKVGVNGTQAPPQVRVVIVTPQTELGFKAEKLKGSGADDWFAEVFIPEDVSPGEYDLRVEVLVNNRLFTPVKRKVEIGVNPGLVAAKQDAEAELKAENVTPAFPTQKPKQTDTWEGEGGALPEVPEIPQPLPSKPLPSEPKEKKSLMGQFAEDKTSPKPLKKSPVVKAKVKPLPVKEKVEAPLLKNFDGTAPAKPLKKSPVVESKPRKEYRVVTPWPKPSKNKTEPIRIKIADIAAESEKRFDKVLKESATYQKPGVSVAPININHQTPTALKKGEVVYE